MHLASDACGMLRWTDFLEHTLTWSIALTEASGARFSVFDMGGGWHHDDFRDKFLPMLPALHARIAESMPSVETILLEPGKAVAADTAWLATRVIEVRSASSMANGDVVVDASIADLPMAAQQAHHVLHLRQNDFLGWLAGGQERILGASCMETDILAEGVGFTEPPVAGDTLIFSSAGGYNASMAYHFAEGHSRDK